MIEGAIRAPDLPFVEGWVELPQLGLAAPIPFLVDTGATGTVLHPKDAISLGVDFSQLDYDASSRGIGGSAKAARRDAVILFQDGATQEWYEYRLLITIAEPSKNNRDYPSLLGRNVLRCWRTVYDPTNGILHFDVLRTGWAS